jgi:hypothetical protein
VPAPNSVTDQFDLVVTSTMRNYLTNNFHDNIFNKMPLLAWLQAAGRYKSVDGGDYLVEPLMYGKNTTVKSFGGYDQFDVQPMDGFTAATYNWKGVGGSLVYGLEDKLKNTGKSKIIDLIEARTKQLELSIREAMSEMLFGDGTGNGGKDVLGLQAIIDDTGTLGGIDSGTYTWWQAYKDDDAEAMDIADWRRVYNEAGAQVSKPKLIMTTMAYYEWYEGQVAAKLSINDRQGSNPLGDLGFDTLRYKGALVTWDEECPASNAFFLPEDFLTLRYHKDANFNKTEPQRPANQLAWVYLLYWYGNLTTGNRRRFGRLKSKTV